ncbi:MAG TPA: hypothetical protein VKY31_10325, partial [Terriglobia bacterium]|nr:hypothetical protein [Terriglobia bacterium]
MRVSRIVVIVLVALALTGMAAPARAQVNTNFIKDFLARYKSPTLAFPASPATASPQAINDLVRSGQLPLTMGELINLMLQNNLDIGVDRLSPLSSQYQIDTFYRTFEPSMHFKATVNRNTIPGTSILAGAANPSTLSGLYNIGFAQNLTTG